MVKACLTMFATKARLVMVKACLTIFATLAVDNMVGKSANKIKKGSQRIK